MLLCLKPSSMRCQIWITPLHIYYLTEFFNLPPPLLRNLMDLASAKQDSTWQRERWKERWLDITHNILSWMLGSKEAALLSLVLLGWERGQFSHINMHRFFLFIKVQTMGETSHWRGSLLAMKWLIMPFLVGHCWQKILGCLSSLSLDFN